MKSKKTIIIITAIILFLLLVFGGGIIYLIYGPTYSASGQISEYGTNMPLSKIKITVGKKSTNSDKNGKFEITGVRRDTAINFTIPDIYEKLEKNYKVDKRKTILNIKLCLGLVPTEEKLIGDIIAHRYDNLWEFMHPDDKARWKNRDEYINLQKNAHEALQNAGLDITRIEINQQKITRQESMTNPLTNKKYTNIYIIYETQYYKNGNTEKLIVPYQMISGFWHYLSATSRQVLEDIIKDPYKEVARIKALQK